MVKNLKIYVFDMGGVIKKSAKLEQLHSVSEMKCDYRDFRKYFYHSQEAKDVYNGFITDDEFFTYIKEITGTRKSASELKRLYLLSKGGIYLDTMRMVYELKNSGNSVHLLSNLKEIDYEYLKDNIDVNLFDKLFLSYKLGMSKPDEDIYTHVIYALGTNQFHFFDDSRRNVLAALECGIHAHQVTGESIVKTVSQIVKK